MSEKIDDSICIFISQQLRDNEMWLFNIQIVLYHENILKEVCFFKYKASLKHVIKKYWLYFKCNQIFCL